MADNSYQAESLGEVYAQALINEAIKQNVLAEVTEDIRGIGELLSGNELFLRFSQALTIGEDERLATIDKIFGGRLHQLTVETLKSLSRRDRFMFLGGLVEGFQAIIKKMDGHEDVEVISASELRPEVLDRLKEVISRNVGKVADVKVTIKPSLIGGMMVRIGDTLIDGSVATQLSKMEELLMQRGLSSLQDNTATLVA